MSKPAIILTHGAWHTPQAFERIVPILEQNGHSVSCVEFPSVFQTPTPVEDMQADIQAVRDAVTKELDAGRDVVLGVHSWSGAPVNSALEGLSKKERVAQGKQNGVVKLVFIAAFVVPEGVCIFDAVGSAAPPLWRVEVGCLGSYDGRVEDADDVRRRVTGSYRTSPRKRSTTTLTPRIRSCGRRVSGHTQRLRISQRRLARRG